MYTTKDLEFSKSTKCSRKWNPLRSEWDYKEEVSSDVSTSDGLFKSYTDSEGYSYWKDNQITYGNQGTDYFFICKDFADDEQYLQKVVDLLNRLAF